MNIGIIGSGNIGGTAARLFAHVGHQVAISNARGPASLAAFVQSAGAGVRAATVADAAAFGDLVLVAIPFGKYETLPAATLAGKIVVDATNYYPQRDGTIALHGLTSSGLIAQYLTGAHVVKAFNTMASNTLATRGDTRIPLDRRLVLLLAGDDAAAKATTAQLIEEIGFAPYDMGALSASARQEPDAPIYNHPMTLAEARTLAP